MITSTMELVQESDKDFFEKHKSKIQCIENDTRAVSTYVKRWKVVSAITLVLEVLVVGSLLYVAIYK